MKNKKKNVNYNKNRRYRKLIKQYTLKLAFKTVIVLK